VTLKYKIKQVLNHHNWWRIIFFGDIQRISCDLIGEGLYTNCSNKEPEEIKPKDHSSDEITEKKISQSEDEDTELHLENISFKNLFNILNTKQSCTIIITMSIIIFFIIFFIIYVTKVVITIATDLTN
jgi:hypothetical protein